MSSLYAQLSNALADIQAGRISQSLIVLEQLRRSQPQSSDVWRLSAMAARKAGDPVQAEAWLHQSLALSPGNPEALNALGLSQDAQGRTADALNNFKAALERSPDFVPAAINLARLYLRLAEPHSAVSVLAPFANSSQAHLVRAQALQATGALLDAVKIYEDLVRVQPQNLHAHYGLALCRIDLGEPDRALPVLDNLLAAGLEQVQYPRFTALAQLKRYDEALIAVEAALAVRPDHRDGLHGLAQLLWMMGRAHEIVPRFEYALKQSNGQAGVYAAYLDVLIQIEAFDAARALSERAILAFGMPNWLSGRRLAVEIEAGNVSAAVDLARSILSIGVPPTELHANLARALLMGGDYSQSASLVSKAAALHPEDRFWTAMQTIQARAEGNQAEYERLVNLDAFTMTAPIDVPQGYENLASFNESLAQSLRKLHDFSVAPLDQSLRAGSQTPTSLRYSQDPAIKQFFKMAERTFHKYCSQLRCEPGHPLLGSIPDVFNLVGAWSVKLGPGGRHVNHVHPEGWISSVYYVDVPSQVQGSPAYEGWLKFSEPPFPVAGQHAERYVQPRAGELTLFPSYFWHGTEPIQSGERLTIAFDIAPKGGL